MPSQTSERVAFRRRLGVTLARIRKRLTAYATQLSIAEELGIDRETYGRWERGLQEPTAYELYQLSQKFKVPAEWLVSPTDSVTELDRRIAELRAVASEAARAEAGEGPAQPDGGGKAPRRGRPKA